MKCPTCPDTALVLADSQVCKAEIDVLARLRAHEQLGLRPEELHSIVHAMCDDMLSTAELTWADAQPELLKRSVEHV